MEACLLFYRIAFVFFLILVLWNTTLKIPKKPKKSENKEILLLLKKHIIIILLLLWLERRTRPVVLPISPFRPLLLDALFFSYRGQRFEKTETNNISICHIHHQSNTHKKRRSSALLLLPSPPLRYALLWSEGRKEGYLLCRCRGRTSPLPAKEGWSEPFTWNLSHGPELPCGNNTFSLVHFWSNSYCCC